MHWGNLSFYLPKNSPSPLAPVYGMLHVYLRLSLKMAEALNGAQPERLQELNDIVIEQMDTHVV